MKTSCVCSFYEGEVLEITAIPLVMENWVLDSTRGTHYRLLNNTVINNGVTNSSFIPPGNGAFLFLVSYRAMDTN